MLKSQLSSFAIWNKPVCPEQEIQQKLLSLGIRIDLETGHLYYSDNFSPLSLDFELVFVRHGETYGNCGQSTSSGQVDKELVEANTKDKEKRIYQGDVDTEINQLTSTGKKEAFAAAEEIYTQFIAKGWEPDFVLASPLQRAKDTALALVTKMNYEDRFNICHDIREMYFGSWENRRVCDINTSDACHRFYREQHALVKGETVAERPGESFCEVLLRAYETLKALNSVYAGKKILMFSHSMFGAACSILLGHGQKIENGNYLAFDGKRSDGSYYTMPHATPIGLHVPSLELSNRQTCK